MVTLTLLESGNKCFEHMVAVLYFIRHVDRLTTRLLSSRLPYGRTWVSKCGIKIEFWNG